MSATRRAFLVRAGAAALGLAFWQRSLHAAGAVTRAGTGPYGPLRPPDANGLMLPEGFRSRVVARSGASVPGTAYVFPQFPDGAATFALPDGGWIHTINSEVPGGAGGVSALRYAPDGRVTGAQRILGGTSLNCAGGATPWGTWLSCEEVDAGRVWECDPTGSRPAQVRPALGTFKHEACVVDPVGQRVYLSEDAVDGCLYRFTPAAYPSLDAGALEVALVGADGRVGWRAVPDPGAQRAPTRTQVPGATRFARGEGMWFDDGIVLLATTADETVHALDTRMDVLSVLYRRRDVPGSPLQAVDTITVSRSGDLFVCEDAYDDDPDGFDVCMITREGEVARFLKLTGPETTVPGDPQTELTGVVFDPSGTRMYVGSQRGAPAGGVVYEVTGPFRLDRPAGARPGGVSGPTGPALGVAAPARRRIVSVLRDGLPVALTLVERADVTVTVRARATVAGRRRTVVLARRTARLGPGPQRLSARVRRADRRALLRRRRASLRTELEVRVGGASVRRTAVLVAR